MKFLDADGMDAYLKKMKAELDDPNGTPIQYQPQSHMHSQEWGSEPNPEKCIICYLSQP